MRILFLSLGLLTFFAGDLPSQWGPRGCGPVGPTLRMSPYAHAQSPAREWRQLAQDPGRWHLFVGGKQIGAYCPTEGIYRALEPRGWGPPSDPPADLPTEARAVGKIQAQTPTPPAPPADEPGYNGGLLLERMMVSPPETIWHGSLPVTLDEVIQSIENVPDFRGKPRFTVLSPSAATRARVLADAKTAGLAGSFILTGLDPSHWHARDREGKDAFRATTDPTILVQAPDGRVLHRQAGYDGPADLQAARKADPLYDPAKDPDLRKPAPVPVVPGPPAPSPPALPFDFGKIPLGAWLLGAGALIFIYLQRKNP